jgi:hypothetical protein
MIVCKPYKQDASSAVVFAVAFPLFFLYVLYQIHSSSHGDPSAGTISLYVIFSVFIIGPPAYFLVSIWSVRYNETYGEIYFERLIGNRILMADDITNVRIRAAFRNMGRVGPANRGGGGESTTSVIFKFITSRESIEVADMYGLSDLVDALQKANPKIEVVRP